MAQRRQVFGHRSYLSSIGTDAASQVVEGDFKSAFLEEGHRVELEVLPILLENAQCYVRRRSERHAGIWQGHGARFVAPLDCELHRIDGNVSLLSSLARDQVGWAGSLGHQSAHCGCSDGVKLSGFAWRGSGVEGPSSAFL